MNNAELDKLLRQASAPERDAGYWAEFPQSVTRRLRQQPSAGSPALRPRPSAAWIWGLGLASAAMLMGLVAVFWSGRSAPEQAQVAAMQKYFAEISGLFPNQLRAIVLDDQGPHLLLADEPSLPNAQPLYVKICGPKGCQRVVTFSGQQIRLNGEVCDVLLNAQGQVLVAGEHWVWSSATAAGRTSRYRIQAQPLEVSL